MPVPQLLKALVAKSMLVTGEELFLFDSSSGFNSASIDTADTHGGVGTLLHLMATDREFLDPLRAFRKRRLFANLNADFVVPLGTAAFLSQELVALYRQQFASSYGIVTVIRSDELPSVHSRKDDLIASRDSLIGAMRAGLDSMQRDKVLVHFNNIIPIAHNKIAAITKFNQWMDSILGE